MKIALYARVSTGYQVDKDSLPFQQKEMKAYCEHILHRTDFELYEDAGRSGKNTDRPAFQRMMQDIRDGEISHVVVYKIDRISRNLVDFSLMYDEFKKYRVVFISLNEQFDTSTALGEAVLKIILVFAELERKMTSERVKAVMIGRATSGKWNGARMPYGWRWNDETGMPEHDPAESKAANLIYSMYAETKSTTQVMRYLNENGIPTKRGGRWTTKTLCDYLKNPMNRGDYRYNYREAAHGTRKPDEEVIYTSGVFEPLVPVDLWDEVNAIIDLHAEMNNSKNRQHISRYDHLFATLLRCGCGAGIHILKFDKPRANGLRPTLYRCAELVHTQCKRGASSDVWLAPFVFNFIYRVILMDSFSFEDVEGLRVMLLDAPEFKDYDIADESLIVLLDIAQNSATNIFMLGNKKAPKSKKTSKYHDDIEKCKRALQRLDKAYLYDDSVYSEAEYTKMRSELTERLTDLKNKAASESKSIVLNPAPEIPKATLMALISSADENGHIDFASLASTCKIKELHELLKSMIDKIVVDNKRVTEIKFLNGIDVLFS